MKKVLAILSSVCLLFSVVQAASITVTSPNGTEVWIGCSVHNVTWTASGTSGQYNIDYSTNNGTTWTSVASYLSAAGTYSWTVPNVQSSSCLVRVMDSYANSTVDSSNSVFTINAPLILTSPNGGEIWQVGAGTHFITWAAVGTSNYYTIEYSTTAGASWTTIVNNTYITSGSYTWTIPNFPSTNCLVRVTDYYNSCMTDQSNALFTISPPTPVITVTQPNGGENWYIGSSYYIYWTSAYLSSSNVVIDYSADNGANWNSVVASTSNTGSYNWTIPNNPSSQCLVRVMDFGNNATRDSSNAVFNILNPVITVTSPNGTESWVGCSTHNITWTSGGISSYVKIEYSLNGGSNWTTIVNGASNNGSYSWTLPGTPSTNCLVRVSDYYTNSINDQSNSAFTITQNTQVIVTAPNGTEVWQVGAGTHNITWASTGVSNYWTIRYSTDNGSTWNTIVNGSYITSGTYTWTIPNNPSTTCLVQVYDYYANCLSDVSNATFTISPPTPVITVTQPNGGDNWYIGTAYNITWTSAYLSSSNVVIDYSVDNGSNWLSVTPATSNTGSYSWTVPNNPSSQCLVRVMDFGNTSTRDSSNAVFNILNPVITVTAPNGTESWVGCSSHYITWTSGGISSYVKIEYSLNGGSNWTTIVNGASNTGSYSWTLPGTPSTNCLVRVSDYYTNSINDQSNAAFSITQNTQVIVTAPNGTEVWQIGGSTHNITWASTGVSNYWTIQYSIDNGSTWLTIVNGNYITSGTYTWTIPNNPSTTCLVKVYDYYANCLSDVSNANFTISAPTPVITVTQPNGADNWYIGNSYNITWTSAYLSSSFVALDYSTNNGSTWTSITSAVNNTGSYSWTVPNTPSSQCLVRVMDYGNNATRDSSNAVFNILNPVITVTSPNGTESWVGCSTHNITWTSGGISSYVKIEYSLNGGSNWTTIVNGASNNGSYSWTLPGTPSTNCLVRVSDYYTNSITDNSNGTFTITQNTQVIVTAPNGTEVWQVGGGTHNITWASTGVSNYWTIQYSIDNGSTWLTIVNGSYITSGTYTWTIPNNPSTTCLVKIYDYYASCLSDVSNANFTISAPTPVISLLQPNGSDNWYIGNVYNIVWTSAYLSSSNVVIDYSTNNGSTWTSVTSSTNNTGSYSWTVPNTPSSQCLVRVMDFGNNATRDSSNAVFNILNPVITVTSPNGTESWIGCSTHNITWTSGGISSYVKIEYSLNGGSNWTTVVNGASNNGSYSWTLPGTPSTNCLVRVSDYYTNSVNDQSNSTFTITQNTQVIVTAPNGTEVWQIGGGTHNITWASTGVSNYWTIRYSTDNGSTWNTIVNGSYITSGTYTWTIPNNPSTTCLVQVYDYYANCLSDVSNATFTISPPTPVITVTQPNGGDNWYIGTAYNITWTSAYLSSSFVVIDYSTNNGSTWNSVTASTNNTGSYSWTIPNNPSSQCLVRVMDYGNNATRDSSNAVFNILNPVITVTTPNGGESWVGCSTHNVTWTSGGISSYVKIDYSINGGSTWINIVNGASNNGSYSWTLPGTVSTNCLVRVSDYYTNLITDNSNGTFTITPNTQVIVTSPNGGEVWQVGGGTHNITWASTGVSNYWTIQYSTDNGSTWNTITNGSYITNGTYTWTIPNNPSTTCLVKVYDYYANCLSDVSNATFTISPPTPVITVTSPNGGETAYIGGTYSITWTSAYLSSSFVAIDYSTNNGVSWTNVISATNNTGSYSWTVPNTATTQALIKISDYGNAATYDVSNSIFTISRPIVITSPNGGETWAACTATSITWNAGGTSYYYNIDYSTNGGSTWTSAVSAYYTTASSCTYNWTIPNLPSGNCYVKVTDYYASAKGDTSNAVFSITPAITVTSPNYGGTLQIGSIVNLTWSSTGASSYFNIDYSTNGGIGWTNIITFYNTVTNTYAWTVPNAPSSNCLIRVTDYSSSCKTDKSDYFFTINNVTPAIVITSPNGGENLTGCTAQNITWTASGTSGNYNIDYSTNGTTSWTNIVTNFPASGSYTWTIPNIGSSNCLVRVTDFADGTKTDISNAAFTLTTSPAQPGAITGNNSVCSGTSQTYSIGAVSGATAYVWTLPSGWTGSSSATSITATAGSSGAVTVYATNGCGSGTPQTLNVNVLNIPAQPSSINGTTTVCSSSSNNYSVTPVSGATNYTWSLPSGWTGSSTTNSISATAGTTGTLTVTANNTCGSSTQQTLAVTVNSTPSVPGSISGSTTVCTGAAQTYSISAVSGATSYNWSLPSGWGGSSSGTTISVTPGTSNGNISVTASNACGTSSAQTLAVTVTPVPAQPGTVTGNATVCLGSAQTYSITAVGGATSYTWTFPGGWTGSSTTNSITPTAGSSSGAISVAASNTCGTSSAQNFSVTVVPSVLGQPGSITGNMVICSGSVNNYSISSVSGATSYTWTYPSGWSGSSTTTSISATSNSNSGNVTVAANNVCGSGTTSTAAVTVNSTVPSQPGSISGSTVVCQGVSVTYGITSVAGATSYSWILPSGWSGISASNTITANSGATGGSVQVAAVNPCGTGTYQTLAVTVTSSAPAQPGTIAGLTDVCQGSTHTYSISSVTNATSYNWVLPATWTGSSTTNSITVTAGTAGGNVAVSAANNCGTSIAQTLNTNVITTPPVQPGTIGGASAVCASSTQTYTITSVSGATGYTWNLPSGWSGSSTSTSINATAGSAGGTISVTADNDCGSGTAQALSVSINPLPNQPGTISGNTTICGGSLQTYSVGAVAGATSYSWSFPSGWSGSSSTNTVSVTAGIASGNVSVTAYNACGAGTPQTLAVSIVNSVLSQPGVISGNSVVCSGSGQTYSVTNDPSATGYTWTTPSGWVGSSTTNSITLTAGVSGVINVTADNVCGSSASQTIIVTVESSAPAQPGSMTGNAAVCSGSSQTYSIISVSGATSYTWALPSGWSNSSTGLSIATTPGITSGIVSVTADNSCGSSPAQSTSVTVTTGIPAQPGSISGNATVCSGTSQTYSITSVSGATSYTWTPISSWTGSASGNAITYTAGISSGTISVTADNVCGSSPAQTISVLTATGVPAQPSSVIGNAAVCAASTQTYSVTSVSGVTSYTWTTPGVDWTGSSVANSASFTAGTSSGNISVIANNICGSSISSDLAITTNAAVPAQPLSISGNTTLCAGTALTYFISSVSGASSYTWSMPSGWTGSSSATSIASTAGTSGTSISVSADNSCGSSVAQTLSVSVTNIPVTAAGSDVFICIGNNTTLNATGGTTFLWIPATGLDDATSSTPVASPSATTTYTVASSNACGSSSDAIIVNVNSLPVAAAGSDISICSGGSTTLNAGPGAAYSWMPTTGLSDASIINPVATLTGTETYTLTVTNGCGSASDDVVVTVVPLSNTNAGSSVSICPGNNTTLNGSGSMAYTWSPATGLSDPNIANPVANPTSTTTYTLTDSNICGTTLDMMTVTVNPLPVAAAGSDVSMCSGSSTTLNAGPGAGYSWSPITGLSNSAVQNPVATLSTSQTYTLTVTNGCGSASDDVSVTVIQLSNVNAGTDVSICPGNNTTLNGSGALNSYTWSPVTGLNNSTIANPVANPSVTTTYTLTDANSCGTVLSIVLVTVGINPNANAGLDATICSGNTTGLNASGGTTYSWLPVIGLTNPSIANPTANPTTTTTYTVTATTACGSMDDAVLVTVNPLPVPNAGADLSVCTGSSTTMNASGGSSYLWSPVTGLSNSNIANPVVNITSTATYTVTVSTVCGSGTDVMQITVNPVPAANAGTDASVCSGNIIIIGSANVIGNSYSWSPATGLSSSTISNPSASPTANTTYTMTETIGATGCQNSHSVFISVAPLPNADAGPDATICAGGSTTLFGSGGVGYSWTPVVNLSNGNIQHPVANPTSTITYSLTVTGANGCAKVDAVTVFVDPCTGIETENPEGSLVRFYPNPFTNNATIELINVPSGSYTFEMYDVLGEKVFSKIISDNKTEITPSGISPGVYFWKVLNSEGKLNGGGRVVMVR